MEGLLDSASMFDKLQEHVTQAKQSLSSSPWISLSMFNFARSMSDVHRISIDHARRTTGNNKGEKQSKSAAVSFSNADRETVVVHSDAETMLEYIDEGEDSQSVSIQSTIN